MPNKLKDIRLKELKEVYNRAKFARASVSVTIIKKVEEDEYLPREDTQAKIVDAVNTLRKRKEPYTREEVFGNK